MVVIIDGPMINEFIDDVDYFRQCADDCFHELDVNGTGFLSKTDLRQFLTPWFPLEDEPVSSSSEDSAKNCDLIFSKFDADGNGSIDREEFRPMMMEILIAMARGIGPTPVSVGVEEGSLLARVYEHDLVQKNRELVEIDDGKVDGSGWKKLLKKKSKKTLNICGCSGGRCFGGKLV